MGSLLNRWDVNAWLLFYRTCRWRLQKAFYTDASIGATGCSGIGFEDIFLRWTCVSQVKRPPLAENEPGPLSLGDLQGVKPQYLSNIVVNEWRVAESDSKLNYGLLIMSPTEIERLDRQPQEEQFQHKLEPRDIDLSAAMATSAAAVAHHMGAYEQSTESFKQLQTVLGLGMGAPMVSDVEGLKREHCCLRVSTCSCNSEFLWLIWSKIVDLVSYYPLKNLGRVRDNV